MSKPLPRIPLWWLAFSLLFKQTHPFVLFFIFFLPLQPLESRGCAHIKDCRNAARDGRMGWWLVCLAGWKSRTPHGDGALMPSFKLWRIFRARQHILIIPNSWSSNKPAFFYHWHILSLFVNWLSCCTSAGNKYDSTGYCPPKPPIRVITKQKPALSETCIL